MIWKWSAWFVAKFCWVFQNAAKPVVTSSQLSACFSHIKQKQNTQSSLNRINLKVYVWFIRIKNNKITVRIRLKHRIYISFAVNLNFWVQIWQFEQIFCHHPETSQHLWNLLQHFGILICNTNISNALKILKVNCGIKCLGNEVINLIPNIHYSVYRRYAYKIH